MNQSILFENDLFRFELGQDACAKSLILKSTGEELLDASERLSMFSVTQERPFNNEVKLSHPNKRTTYPANSVTRDGNRLIIGFDIAPYEAVVEFKLAKDYLSFTLVDFIVHEYSYPWLHLTPPPVSEFRLIRLPLKNREKYGEWLNVLWDDFAAINVLAACPEARIESEMRYSARVLTADADASVKLRGVTASMIACKPDSLLDCIESIEVDYDLPRGVAARRAPTINRSVYWSNNVNPSNVDEHIRLAKQGGFQLLLMYYTSFFVEDEYLYLNGNYDFRPEYPNGFADLRAMLAKIKAAGIEPGLHFLQTHIGLKSRYVTPHVDHRLNLTRRFTLSRPLGKEDDVIYVEQNPRDSVMFDDCRYLTFGGEMMHYDSFDCEPPYYFRGIKRGAYKTEIVEHPLGQIGGILDISEFGAQSCYIDQNTGLQDEIADKVAEIYGCGFRFIYLDGSEGATIPYAHHVSNAQYRVYKKFEPKPFFCEGAAKSHFGWHWMSGGNAFDIFEPKIFKAKIAEHPAEEAPRMRNDFTRLNFGWWGFWNPGTQADLIEYGAAKAAAWNCPVTMQMDLDVVKKHPRLDDILEAMRRWEDVRAKGWLDDEKKEILKDLSVEHTLLLNENKEYELVRYTQIAGDQAAEVPLRAFIFERNGKNTVVFWHTSGFGNLSLPFSAKNLKLQKELYGEQITISENDGKSIIPTAGKQYLTTDLSEVEIRKAFENAVFFE